MQSVKDKYPALYKKAMAKFGNDPLYVAVLEADSKADMERAMDTLSKIRGPRALSLLKRTLKKALSRHAAHAPTRREVAHELLKIASLITAKKPEGLLFTKDEVAEVSREIERGLNAPFVHVQKATLGPTATVMILVSLDPKSEWQNNILENSRYFRMSLQSDGELDQFTRSHEIAKKFRKRYVKDASEAVKKINQYIKQMS